ncbi:MAG: helix-turn-helix domain-containing protein [Saprospiraceae bacterium]|nr:helix-turn-helix domain-containing protein [Saprospiraceae bacterium]
MKRSQNVQLAKELGISRQLISDILNYRRNINKDMVIKLAYHFKLCQDALAGLII